MSAGGPPPVELSVVMPAYNEGDAILPALESLARSMPVKSWEAMVVVDSKDDTTIPPVEAMAARVPQVRIHLNQRGRGVLNAMRSGFDTARGGHVLVTMADGSDDHADLPAMWAQATAGADVVAASRYMRGGRQVGGPLLKRSLSRLAGLSLHWVGGLGVRDPTSNYKLYSRRLLDAVAIESQAGFELAIELTVKAHLAGMRVAEVPTTWRDRTAGESRFRLWHWLPHYLRWYRRGIAGRVRQRRGPT